MNEHNEEMEKQRKKLEDEKNEAKRLRDLA